MLCVQNKEVVTLLSDQQQLVELKAEVMRLRTMAQSSRLAQDRLAELERLLEELTAELNRERQSHQAAVDELSAASKQHRIVSSTAAWRDSVVWLTLTTY